jgi:cell division septal protein FtsQ
VNRRARVIALSILIFGGLVYLFAWSSIFTVKSIEVTGLPKGVSAQTIISKSDIAIGEKLARIEPRATEKKLSELSWIKKVDVNRNWIHSSVVLKVQGRRAVGIFQGKALDSSGYIFEYPGKLPTGLPLVSASTPALGLKAIVLFTGLPAELRDQVLSMTALNESSISSVQQLGGRTVTVRWGAAEQIPLKVSVYQALIALPENKNIVRIDLSAPHAPIVK